MNFGMFARDMRSVGRKHLMNQSRQMTFDRISGKINPVAAAAGREAGYMRKSLGNMSSTNRKYVAGGVVGVSSGAYMWHRHRMNDQMYSTPAPYYY